MIMTFNENNASVVGDSEPTALAVVADSETAFVASHDETEVIPPDQLPTQAGAYSDMAEPYDDPGQTDTQLAPVWAAPASWTSTWGVATVMVALAAAVAFVIGIWGWIVVHRDDPAPTVSMPSTMPAAALPPIAETPNPAAPTTCPPGQTDQLHSGYCYPVPRALKTSDPDVVPPTTTVTVQAPPPTVTVEPPVPPGRTWTSAQEQEYLKQMRDSGLGYTSPSAILGGAKAVCVDFDNGMSYAKLNAILAKNRPDVNAFDRTEYLAIAVHVLCPEHQDLLP
jgi:Protein of unknown function (DUF732)